MANRFTELGIDCRDPSSLARFWAEVLDYGIAEEDDDSVAIQARDGSWPVLFFVRVPEAKQGKNRLHLDLSPTDREQDAELERLLALGARPVDIGQGDVSWVVLSDPEGNEFCLLRRRRPV